MTAPEVSSENATDRPVPVFDQDPGVIGPGDDQGVSDNAAAGADAAVGEDAQPDDAGDDDAQPEERPASREARYRTERNAARERVGELETQLTNLQEHMVANIASTHLVNGHDAVLWGGVADCLDEHGVPDPAKVRAVCEQLGKDRPYMLRPRPSFVQGERGAPAPITASWKDVIAKGLRNG